MHLQVVEGEVRATLRSTRGRLTVVAATAHLPEGAGVWPRQSAEAEGNDLYIEVTFRGEAGDLFRSRLRFAADGLNEELVSVSAGGKSQSFWRQIR
jgi:hypothetical protein